LFMRKSVRIFPVPVATVPGEGPGRKASALGPPLFLEGRGRRAPTIRLRGRLGSGIRGSAARSESRRQACRSAASDANERHSASVRLPRSRRREAWAMRRTSLPRALGARRLLRPPFSPPWGRPLRCRTDVCGASPDAGVEAEAAARDHKQQLRFGHHRSGSRNGRAPHAQEGD